MPREIYIAAPQPVTLPALVTAGAAINDQLALRALFEGSAMQLVDSEGVAVLTIESSRLLEDGTDAARTTRGLHLPPGEVWWTEAWAPWGSSGAAGVAIAEQLARLIAGGIRIEDGT